MLAYFRNLAEANQRRGDDGASAVEYGLLVAAIAAVIVGVVFAVGVLVNGAFSDTCEGIRDNDSNTTNNSEQC